MGSKEAKILKRDIENAYCVVVDTWMRVEYMLDKNLITKSDAKGYLDYECKKAKELLSQSKSQNKEVFEQYEARFKVVFKSIDEFCSNLSTGLTR